MIDKSEFLRHVSAHEMTVLLNNGNYRHLDFGIPGSSEMQFSIVTWPGYLSYSGDMGDYVFKRVEDMFKFFRHENEKQDPQDLYINQGYWSEKCTAHGGLIKEFSERKFKESVKEYFDEYIDSNSDNEELLSEKDEIWSRINDEVLLNSSNEHRAMIGVSDFIFRGQDGESLFEFSDFVGERDFTEFSYHFTWACFAIAWAIRQYDASLALTASDKPSGNNRKIYRISM